MSAEDVISFCCACCGEENQLTFDFAEGSAQVVLDCEVCCRPMTVSVRVRGGEVETVDVEAA